jgi:TRAP-type C4-dicarboxylate transport system substrate-binding protein
MRTLPPNLSLSPPAFRRIVRFAALALAAVHLAAPPAATAASVAIRMGTLVPSGTTQHKVLLGLAEQWRQAGGDALKFTLYPDGRLGGESEMVKKMRIKHLNAAALTVVGLTEIDPGVAGLQLVPMLFKTWEEVDYVREKLRPLLEERLRAKGYAVLFWADAGWVRFYSKRPAFTPDDYKKMKMFTWTGDQKQAEIMKSLGYRPVVLETTDIPLGLNTDMINAVPLPPLVALASQAYRSAPHMLDLNWVPIVGAAVIRLDAWNQLPEPLRRELLAAGEIAGAKLRDLGRNESDEAVRAMQEKGLQIHSVPPELQDDWQQLADSFYPKLRGMVIPPEIFDAVLQHLADFRRSGGAAPAR